MIPIIRASSGDVGMAGVAIDSIYDMRTLFDGIPLDQMSVSMTMNGAVLPVLALFIVAAEEQGVPAEKLTGTIQNDILKEFMVRNTYIYPPDPSMRIVSDIFAYTSKHMPKFNSISISGYHMQEAGASADLELGYTLADGVEYVRAGVAAGLDIDAFAPRLSFFFAIGMNFFMEVAKLRAARLLVGAADEGSRREIREEPDAAHALPDLRLVADGAGRLRQRHPHLRRGDGGDAGAYAIAAHQCARRGARAADRLLGAHRPQHADRAAGGERHDPHHRSLGRLLLCRAPDRGTRQGGLEAYRGDRDARRHGQGDRRRRAQAAHRRGGREDAGAHRQRNADRRRREQISARDNDAKPNVLKVDNAAVRAAQLEKLARLRAERDEAKTQGALDALTEGATSGANLLDLAVKAARAKASVGEISFALEKVFSRHKPKANVISGVYAKEAGKESVQLGRVIGMTRDFEENAGRKPRILVAKMGQDGHDRGQKVIASAFADMGFDVVIGDLFATPDEVAQKAKEADVHIVGVSTMTAGHLTLTPELRDALTRAGRGDIMMVVGGVIPPDDFQALYDSGAAAIFPPGTNIPVAAEQLLHELNIRLGFAQREVAKAG